MRHTRPPNTFLTKATINSSHKAKKKYYVKRKKNRAAIGDDAYRMRDAIQYPFPASESLPNDQSTQKAMMKKWKILLNEFSVLLLSFLHFITFSMFSVVAVPQARRSFWIEFVYIFINDVFFFRHFSSFIGFRVLWKSICEVSAKNRREKKTKRQTENRYSASKCSFMSQDGNHTDTHTHTKHFVKSGKKIGEIVIILVFNNELM